MNLKNNYEQYLRKEYDIPDECDIIIKHGFVMSKSEELTKNENAENDPFKIRSLVYKDQPLSDFFKKYPNGQAYILRIK